MYSIKHVLTILGLGVTMFTAPTQAQAPDWTVDPSAFQFTMTLTTFLNIDGNTLISEQDQLGAFVDNELRGATKPIFVSSADRYLAYLTIFSNTVGEEVEFKIYNSSGGQLVAVDTTIIFEVDEHYGNVFQALSLAVPPLSNEAEILNFGFTDIDSVSTAIKLGVIDVLTESGVDLISLIPEFVISQGAELYNGRMRLQSEALAMDFSGPIVISVLSEDESVLNLYLVTVSYRVESDFISTNVITANGDGQNDFWIVQDASLFSNYSFKIFDVNGRILYESMGYNNDWDGSYKGARVDRGNYYYMVRNMFY